MLHLSSCTERKSSYNTDIKQELAKSEKLKEKIFSDPSKSDSVLNEILSLSQDSIKSKVLYDISYNFYSKRDSLNFRLWNKITLHHSLNSGDTARVAESYWDLANFFYKEKILDSSYYYYNVAFDLYEQVNDDYHAARMLINLATIQKDIKDYQTSEITAIRALSKLRPLKKKYQLYLTYNILGITNNHLEQYNEALNFHEKALQVAEDLGDGTLKALTLNNIGVVYKNLEQYPEAIRSYKAAQGVDSLQKKYPELHAMLIDNLAYARFMSKDYVNVEKDLLRSLALRKEIDHFSGIATSYLHLGDYYLNFSDTSRAYQNYVESREIAIDKKLNEEFLESTLALAKIGGGRSQEFYNDYIEKSTEFLQEERAVKNRFAKIRFQTDELIAETKRLTQQRVWITVVSVLVIMFLLLLYYLRVQQTKNRALVYEREQRIANEEIYKLMLKQQSKLEEGRQQERERISSDLHDGVLGRLYGTRLSLEFLNIEMSQEELNKFSALTTELQKIEKEVREISHDLVSENFFKDSSFVNLMENLLEERNKLGITTFNFQNSPGIRWEDLNEEVKLDLYRIVQEGTQNIVKHSGAKEAWIALWEEDSKIMLIIRDNGSGFSKGEEKNGIGLKNTRSRIKKWNGELFITASPGQGTEIRIELLIENGV